MRRAWLILPAFALLLIIVACSEASPTPTPPPTPPTLLPSETVVTAPILSPTPTPTGVRGGRLTTLTQVNVPHLDVHQEVQETLASMGPGLAYSRLMRLSTGPESDYPQPSLLVECDLCESWEALDPLTYSFKLREGIRWHDVSPVNGRELTAGDVAYSLERLRTPGWPNAGLLRNIDSIDVVDSHTINVSLAPGFPDADFMVSLADGHAKVVAPEVVEMRGDLKEAEVIGTGPWRWISTREDVGTLLERNESYFEAGLPYADELFIRVIEGSDEARLAAFATGVVDVYRLPPGLRASLEETGVHYNSFLSRQSGAGLVLTMNTSVPPFDDLRVRQAVLLALDPWRDLDILWEGQGYVSAGIPVRSPKWLLGEEEVRGTYLASTSRSRNIVESIDAGALAPFRLDVGDFGDLHLEYGHSIAEDLRAVGFDVLSDPVALTPPEYRDKVWMQGDYQVAVGPLPPTVTTNSYLLNILHSSSALNVTRHTDEVLDTLIAEQATERDPAARGEMVRQIQRRVLEQAYMIATVTDGDMWVFHSKVRGFHPNTAASEYFFWAKTWLEE